MLNIISDFFFAALPWVVISVAIAYIAASWSAKNTKKK